MKKLIWIFVLACSFSFSQSRYLTKNGTIIFEASVPSFEEVKATNNSTTAVLNSTNGEFAALALVKGFRFKNALMEEHFNENYAESDTYSKAKFSGTINAFSIDDLTTSDQIFKINGDLEFHGVKKALKDVELKISLHDDVINISGKFSTKASYFDIEIPKIVSKKIAEDIEVEFSFELQKK